MEKKKKRTTNKNKTNIKVIYSCYWGSYLATVAASLHLSYNNDKYMVREIHNFDFFCDIKDNVPGKLSFLGVDNKGREIFTVGSKNSGKILSKALKGIARIWGFQSHMIVFVDLNIYCDSLLLIGIFLARRTQFKGLGKKLITKSIKNNLFKIAKTVKEVKNLSF